jgi:hypothetical protein
VVAAKLFSPGFFSNDTWWHLATGKWIWENGTIPRQDPFSWSLPGVSWINHEWLFQFLLYFFGGSTYGAIFFCALPVVFAVFMMWKLAGEKPSLPAVASFVWTAMALAPGITARPQLFDFAFFAFMMHARRLHDQRWLYTIPPVILVWSNMHSAAILGVGLAVLDAVMSFIPRFEFARLKHDPGDKKTCLTVAGLSVLASLATPIGAEIYLCVLNTMSDSIFSRYVQEWMPPPFGDMYVKAPFVVIIGLVIAGLTLSEKRVRLNTILIFCGLLWCTLSGYRFYPLFGVAAAALLGEMWEGSEKLAIRFPVALGIAAGLIAGAALGGVPASYDQAAEQAGFPVQAAARISPGERVLNPYDWGGFLTYKGANVFIDGRADFYRWEGDVDVFADAVIKLEKELEVKEVTDKYRADSLLVKKGSLLDKRLKLEPGWHADYQDDKAVIHRPVPLNLSGRAGCVTQVTAPRDASPGPASPRRRLNRFIAR